MDKQRLTPCLLTVQHVRSGDSQELTWHRKASPPSSPGPSSTLGPLYPFGTTPGAGRPAARARQADGDEAALLPRRSNQRGRPRTSEQTSSQGVQTQTQTREDQGGTEGTGAERVGANGGAPLPQEATSKDRRIRDREGTQIKTRGPYKQASRDGTTTLQRQPKGRRGNANRQELYPKQCNSDQKQDPSLGPEPRPMPKRGPELRSLPSQP